MNLDDARAARLDEVLEQYADELRRAGEANAAVTLAYTHSLHRSWRSVLRMLPVAPDWSVLDMGSGLGVLAFELAVNLPVRVAGVDLEPGFVTRAQQLGERLGAAGLLAPGASVEFSVGDAAALEFPDSSFDLAFVRELFQFLPEPGLAASELLRVIRPGGFACVSDTDDQLRITWPPAGAALSRLIEVVTAVQHGRGGDRQAGRKLTSYLRRAGFEISSVLVLPEAQHRLVGPADAERALIIEQLHNARERVLEAGVTDAVRFDGDLAELEREPEFEEFRMNGRILVLGRRPPGG